MLLSVFIEIWRSLDFALGKLWRFLKNNPVNHPEWGINNKPEVNRPEAIVTANISEHLVVPPENPKERVVEKDIFQSPGGFHPPQVNPGQVILPSRLNFLSITFSSTMIFLASANLFLDVHVVEPPCKVVNDSDHHRAPESTIVIPSSFLLLRQTSPPSKIIFHCNHDLPVNDINALAHKVSKSRSGIRYLSNKE